MTSPRAWVLESGIAAILLTGILSFGGVYAWGYGTSAALVFILLMISPETLLDLKSFPRFSLVCLAAAAVWAVLQTFLFSAIPDVSSQKLMQWASCAGAFMIARRLKRDSLLRLLGFLCVLGAVVSLYGIYELLSGREHVLWQAKASHRGYVTGTYLNRNHFAGFMEIVLGVHLGLLVRAIYKRSVPQILSLTILLIPSFAGLAKSGSRAGMACFLAALFLMSFSLIRRAPGKLAFTWILFLCVGASGFFLGWGTVTARFQDAADQMLSLEGRVAAWRNMIPMLRDHALTGAGLGSFQWIFPAYQTQFLDYGWFHAHQDYLELSVELGVPAVFLLMMGIAVLLTRSLCLTSEKDFSTFALVWGCSAGLLSISFHGLSDFNFAIPAQTLLYFIVLGAVCRLLDFQKQVSVVERGGHV